MQGAALFSLVPCVLPGLSYECFSLNHEIMPHSLSLKPANFIHSTHRILPGQCTHGSLGLLNGCPAPQDGALALPGCSLLCSFGCVSVRSQLLPGRRPGALPAPQQGRSGGLTAHPRGIFLGASCSSQGFEL